MTDAGSILIVDDEETFLLSTAELLRKKGFRCETALNAAKAVARLQENRYDLVIADIQMPGNEDLQFVRELPDLCPGVPVIIVTGYPSAGSAMEAVSLPVVAYLTKPLDIQELLRHAGLAVQSYRTYRALNQAQNRLQTWNSSLSALERGTAGKNQGSPLESFLAITLENIMGSLADLNNLTVAMAGREESAYPCHLLECPKLKALEGALRDTVEVLEETKKSFKSKRLFELRKKLESVLREHGTDNPRGT